MKSAVIGILAAGICYASPNAEDSKAQERDDQPVVTQRQTESTDHHSEWEAAVRESLLKQGIDVDARLRVNTESRNAARALSAVNPSAGEQLSVSVLSEGATDGTGSGLRLLGTFGQVAVGVGTGNAVQVASGFWEAAFDYQVVCCGAFDPQRLAGNATYDPENIKDLNDILLLARYSLFNDPPPVCFGEGNVDGDPECLIDLTDILWLGAYAFLGGGPPSECIATCDQL